MEQPTRAPRIEASSVYAAPLAQPGAPLPGRTGPFPDLDPRIEAAAAAYWEGANPASGPASVPWTRVAAEAPSAAAAARAKVEAILAAADNVERPDPRVEVLARALFKDGYPGIKWKDIGTANQTLHRRRAAAGLAALDKAAKA